MTRSAAGDGGGRLARCSLALWCAGCGLMASESMAQSGWEKVLNCVANVHLVEVGKLTLGHEQMINFSPGTVTVDCIDLSDGTTIDQAKFGCGTEDNESMTITWVKTQVYGRCNPKQIQEEDDDTEEQS